MNKVDAKRRFERSGVPTPPFEVVRRPGDARAVERLGLPVVVKPVASGSSVDTTIARSTEEARSRAAAVARKYGEALVEKYIAGPELTVGILGDIALPVCQIRTHREFYDYHAKYIDDQTEYLFEIDLPKELLEQVQRIGLAAHRGLGCRAFSRVDCMIDAATQSPYILEVNTIPGMTSHSLLPKAAARIGMSFDQLCQRMVELSLGESARR
jgi:D-alanine-D-alanine ligase